MKVVIDWDFCQGHGVCEGELPEVFRLDAEGKLEVLMAEPPEELRAKLEVTMRYCPTGAIRVEG
jgi:ferredoxin